MARCRLMLVVKGLHHAPAILHSGRVADSHSLRHCTSASTNVECGTEGLVGLVVSLGHVEVHRFRRFAYTPSGGRRRSS